MNKKILKTILISLILVIIASCKEDGKAERKFMISEDLEKIIEENSDEHVILDLRQAKDFEEEHIKNSISVDLHLANKEGDDKDGLEKLNKVLDSLDEKDKKKLVLICYTGRSYAKKGYELLSKIGIKNENIITLKGGIKDFRANSKNKELLQAK